MNWSAQSGQNGIALLRLNAGLKVKNCGKPTWLLEDRLIPNPIRKVLSSMRAHRVRALLMGGQACVFYGAAEFSRDTDFAILADMENLARLRVALAELSAGCIAVPPFDLPFLRKGHAIHFRCLHPDALKIRLDVMSRMRGVDSFPELWKRRTTLELPDGEKCDLMSLPDLVLAKKTQRDKDWPMIRRLVEANFFENRQNPNPTRIRFWLRELRTPELLVEVAKRNLKLAQRQVPKRPLLQSALAGQIKKLTTELSAEEIGEREKDRLYWLPLKKELEQLRHLAVKAKLKRRRRA
jgi:hypothetical protein